MTVLCALNRVVWATCWMSRRAYREHKSRHAWQSAAEKRRAKREELEHLAPQHKRHASVGGTAGMCDCVIVITHANKY
jgi:hypothetical protein